jgi:predicted ester cyclase
MKNYQQIFAFCLFCYCSACNDKTEHNISPAAQKNLDAMHGVSSALESKDLSKLGDFISADAVDHAGEHGDIKGLDSIKAALKEEAASITDSKMEVIKELADDDYVMSWEHFKGVYPTDGMGHKAGDKFDMKSLEVAKFKDGKATDHWTFMDPADIMKMEATMAKPTMAADSTKKKM